MELKEFKEIYENEMNEGDGSQFTDGIHTMSELYFNRLYLFSVICKMATEKGFIAFRSLKHADGGMFPNYFIVGIITPEGQYSYHYHQKFWSFFDMCETLEYAPEWDGCLKDDLPRLMSLFK